MMKKSIVFGFLILALAGCGSGSGGSDGSKGKEWKSPVLFSALHEGFQSSRLAIDVEERAMLAWSKDSHVWAASSTDTVTWDSPTQIDDATLRAGMTGFAMNASGEAALVWHAEETDPADHFKARRYSPVTGWEESSQFLDGLTADGSGGAVDINDSGSVMAVFARNVAGGHVWARSYTDAGGWSPASTRLDDQPNYSNSPDVALDGDGNATAVWEQWDGTRNRAFARRYDADDGWDESVTPLDGSEDPSVNKVRVNITADGDGLAHWTLTDYSGLKVRRLVSGSWQAVETVATGTSIYESDARVAPDGRIVQAWADNHDVRARICADGVWAEEETLVSDDDETVNLRSWVMAMDRTNGRVVVMWTRLAEEDADGSAVWARRYDPAKGWSEVEEVVDWTPGILYDVDDAVLLDDGRVLGVLAGEDITVWEYSTYLIGYR